MLLLFTCSGADSGIEEREGECKGEEARTGSAENLDDLGEEEKMIGMGEEDLIEGADTDRKSFSFDLFVKGEEEEEEDGEEDEALSLSLGEVEDLEDLDLILIGGVVFRMKLAMV